MRMYIAVLSVAGLSACSPVVGAVGTGNFNGMPLDADDTTSCTIPGGEITSSGESQRQDLIRCRPQSQSL